MKTADEVLGYGVAGKTGIVITRLDNLLMFLNHLQKFQYESSTKKRNQND